MKCRQCKKEKGKKEFFADTRKNAFQPCKKCYNENQRKKRKEKYEFI